MNKKNLIIASALVLLGASPVVSQGQAEDSPADLLLRKMETRMQLQDENALSQIEEMSISSDYTVRPYGSAIVEWTNILGDVTKQELKPKDPSGRSMFGFNAAVAEGVAAVGAPKEGLMKTGATYIFTYENGEWAQDAKVIVDNGEANDGFGYQLKVYEGKVIIAAPGRDTDAANEGVVYIFEKNDSGWEMSAQLEAKGFYADLHFGRELTLEEGKLRISVTDKKENLSGFKYEFELDGNKSGLVELLPIGSLQETEPDISGAADVVGLP